MEREREREWKAKTEAAFKAAGKKRSAAQLTTTIYDLEMGKD